VVASGAVKRLLQAALAVLFVVLSIGGLRNVLSDNVDEIRAANEIACGDQGKDCRAQMTRMERNPIAQTFGITTPKRTVDVRCTRSLWFFGTYRCELR
jgi:hypothetical protein